ncbi:MAG: hypothetical protein H7222_01830 [Methylotenera sp.]|nr:hypothetical protein [Oligoflexia bacterium]
MSNQLILLIHDHDLVHIQSQTGRINRRASGGSRGMVLQVEEIHFYRRAEFLLARKLQVAVTDCSESGPEPERPPVG